jgi:ribosomal peptide maturation radical SAM protein 1
MVPSTSTPFKLALISMPWSIFNRPSIQLGSLKAFMEKEMSCQVDNFHPYLNIAEGIGIDTYQSISRNSWAGEALFSPLLFNEQKDKARELYLSVLSKKEQPIPDFDKLVSTIEEICSDWINSIEFNQYDLIGFSVCFNQLFSSLYAANQFKKTVEKVPVVFGGSSCTGLIGQSLLHHFPEIDYVIDGEGEQSLLSLCGTLNDHSAHPSEQGGTATPVRSVRKTEEITDINELPYPDYEPYFKEMALIFAPAPFIPTLPLEFSRGCWWNKCSFCNLNLQWKKYRMKNAGRMVRETNHFVQQFECLNFSFADNALPLKQADNYFKTISLQQIDLNFFAEIRAITQPERLKQYSQGGLSTVQVGVESLSNSLLQKMAKGTTVIDNIAVMKLCSENNIQVEGNLITEFPTTTEAEIEETLINIDFVLPYHPLSSATFFLGHGSPIHRDSSTFGINAFLTHHKIKKLFPPHYHKSLEQLINGYRGDRTLQHQLWKPVHQKIKQWQDFHSMRRDKKSAPLQYRDGGTFIIIRQEQLSGQPLQHRLKGISRKMYLFCHTPQSINDILEYLETIPEEPLVNFISELCQKRLMFREEDRVLSLAVRQTL